MSTQHLVIAANVKDDSEPDPGSVENASVIEGSGLVELLGFPECELRMAQGLMCEWETERAEFTCQIQVGFGVCGAVYLGGNQME